MDFNWAALAVGIQGVVLVGTMLAVAWRIGAQIADMNRSFKSFCQLCDARMQEHHSAFARLNKENLERDRNIQRTQQDLNRLLGRHEAEKMT